MIYIVTMCTGEISPTLQSVLFTLPQPRGEVRWWKGSQIWPFGNSRVRIAGAGGSKLKIKKLRTSDEGLYKCQGSKHCQHQGTCEIQTCLIALLTAGKSAVSIEVLVKGLGGHRRHKEVKIYSMNLKERHYFILARAFLIDFLVTDGNSDGSLC